MKNYTIPIFLLPVLKFPKFSLLALIKNQLKIIAENDREHIIQKINEKKREITELEKKLNKNN
ncbi:MAG TPA: hypothetical protein PK626_00410 [Bacteroidales bacterium]|nr:hypothetical protein [Bacteroidales bacterium]